MWKDLTAQQKADLMDIFLDNGVTSLSEMQSIYDSPHLYAMGGPGDEDTGIFGNKTIDTVTSYLPILGTLQDGYRFIKNPSWSNAGYFGLSLASDLTGGVVLKGVRAASKASRAARAAEKTAKEALEAHGRQMPHTIARSLTEERRALQGAYDAARQDRVLKDATLFYEKVPAYPVAGAYMLEDFGANYMQNKKALGGNLFDGTSGFGNFINNYTSNTPPMYLGNGYTLPEVVVTGKKEAPEKRFEQATNYIKTAKQQDLEFQDYMRDLMQGMKNTREDAIQKAADEYNIKQEAIRRANRNSIGPQYNATADLQEALWNLGAFDGIKDRRGRDVTYRTAVDGLAGRMTRAAIENARRMGYNIDLDRGTVTKPVPKPVVQPSTQLPIQHVQQSASLLSMPATPLSTNYKGIVDHKVKYGVKDPYMIIDKANNRLSLLQGDKLLRSYEMTSSKNRGDGYYYLQGHEGLTQMPRTTGAGIYTGVWRPTSDYPRDRDYKEPMIELFTGKSRSSMAVHEPVNAMRRSLFNNNNPYDNRTSYGCISIPEGEIRNLYENKMFNTGDSIYVLPEVEGNYIYDNNGNLQMHWGDKNPQKFKTQTGFVGNYKYNTNH